MRERGRSDPDAARRTPCAHTPDRELKPVNSLSRHGRDGTHNTNFFRRNYPAQDARPRIWPAPLSGSPCCSLLRRGLARPLPCTGNREPTQLSWPFSLNPLDTAQPSSRADGYLHYLDLLGPDRPINHCRNWRRRWLGIEHHYPPLRPYNRPEAKQGTSAKADRWIAWQPKSAPRSKGVW